MASKKFLTPINLLNLASDPPTANEGDIYYNTTSDAVKVYANSSWVVIGSGGGGGSTTVSTTEPASPEIGDSWYKNDTGEFYVYDGTYWVEVNGVIENPGISLNQITDVVITSPIDNEILLYNSASSSWINQTTSEAGIVIADDLLDYLTNSSASSIYLTQSDASTTYSLDTHNHTLDSLLNVEINSLNNGEAIVWNSASAAWVNQLIVSGEGGGGATTTVSETAPEAPTLGDSWYKQSTGSFFIYDGDYWVEVNGIVDGLTEDQVQDYASTLFTHSNHTGITATYDDVNGEIILTSSGQDLSSYLTQESASTIYATKTELNNIDALPSQTGNNGKYLTTDGSLASWGILDLSLYLTESSASTTYATQAALNNINGESDQFILPSQIFG